MYEYWGSSPLTRGKPAPDFWRPSVHGLIPAHAGKTSAVGVSGRSGAAHPRSRGENLAGRFYRWNQGGSSPLTRGKLTVEVLVAQPVRLIPAHAGKTTATSRAHVVSRAHPRSRGENGGAQEGAHPGQGSSPLTRGKLLDGGLCALQGGLIPAHAGKTATRIMLPCDG